jgi:hypothetical protein
MRSHAESGRRSRCCLRISSGSSGLTDCACGVRTGRRTSSYWPPLPRICGNWRSSSRCRRRSSQHEARRPEFASLTAVADGRRRRQQTGFVNGIDPIETSSSGTGTADCAPIAEIPGDASVGGDLRPSERARVRDEAAPITVPSSGGGASFAKRSACRRSSSVRIGVIALPVFSSTFDNELRYYG